IQSYFASDDRYVISLVNPFLLWAGLVFFGYYLKNLSKVKREISFLVILVLSLNLPWLLVSRYTFFYYFLTSIPMLAIVLAKGIVDLEKAKGKWGRRLLSLRSSFITGNVLGFLIIYPFLVALPVTNFFVK